MAQDGKVAYNTASNKVKKDANIAKDRGYISKKLAIGDTNNPFKQLFGTLLQLGMTNYVAKHSEVVKLTALDLIDKFVNKKNRFSQQHEHYTNGKENFTDKRR